jgi:hypothetical protein
MKNAYIGKYEEQRRFKRPTCVYMTIILKWRVNRDSVDLIDWVHDIDQWRVLVTTATYLLVP